MKRELLQNTKVHPIASGDAVERAGFLSGVLGAKIGTAGALTVTVEHRPPTALLLRIRSPRMIS